MSASSASCRFLRSLVCAFTHELLNFFHYFDLSDLFRRLYETKTKTLSATSQVLSIAINLFRALLKGKQLYARLFFILSSL